ncbi:hypothetical protein [Nocardia cyriacigeorgica]|nr:hypothetical protein [Nocardia cyriacigeorgica]
MAGAAGLRRIRDGGVTMSGSASDFLAEVLFKTILELLSSGSAG